MTPNRRTSENGLSEVVGFVLILGVLVLVFSLYLTYGIPAQGRENEILQMNEVKDEFVSYKISVDSLWMNKQPNTALGTTFKLGTAGQITQGSNSFMPIMQPVGSSGMIAINQRTPSPENLKIISSSNVQNRTTRQILGPYVISPTPTVMSYDNPPDSLNITISEITAVGKTTNPERSVIINGTNSQGIQWQAWINITPRLSYYNYSTVSCPNIGSCNVQYYDEYHYTGTDISLTVVKNNTKTLSDFILYKGISSSGTPYVIDLLDTPYGLSSDIRDTPSFWYLKYDPDTSFTALITARYPYQYQPGFTYSVPLGSLEYRGNNNYWIPQTYYYQMGGVFLSQNDGVTYKLPPSISFPNGSLDVINVSIIAIAYDTSRTDGIGGSSPVQIKTVMNPDSGDLPYAPIYPNTWNMSINITTPDYDEKTRDMWLNYFRESAQLAGWPESYYDVNYLHPSGYYDCYITIVGPDTDPEEADIDLQVKTVNLTTNVQNVGGI